MKVLPWFLAGLILSVAIVTGQQFTQLQSLIQSGKLAEAETMISQELARYPGHPELHYWLAVVDVQQGRIPKAQAALEALVEEGNAIPPHFRLLGQIYGSQDRFAETANLYRKVLELFPESSFQADLGYYSFRAGMYDQAIEMLEPLATKTSSDSKTLHLLGLSYFGKKDYQTAVSWLSQAAKLTPGDASIQYDLGLAELQGGALDDAVVHLRRSTELNPSSAAAFLYLGRALHDSNLGDDALVAFQRARDLNPSLTLVSHHFGLLYKGRGDYENARKEFEAEVARGTLYPPTYYHLAEVLFRQQEAERALVLVTEALKGDPDYVEARLLAAKIELRLKRPEDALQHAQAATTVDPSDSSAHYVLGRALQALGRREEAAAAFERSRQLADARSGRNP